jgi:hypothetical protein
MAKQLLPEIIPWFAHAFTQQAPDLDLRWEVGLATLPDPQRSNQLTSVVTLYAQLATGNGNQHVANTVLLSAGFDEAYVITTVTALVRNFRDKLAEITRPPAPQPNLADLGHGLVP